MIYRFTLAVIGASLLAACSGAGSTGPVLPAERAGTMNFIASQGLPQINFFATPTQNSWPEYIRMGPDGNLWFTEFYANQLARITPNGTITEFREPDNNDVEALVTGPDGNIWFTDPGANRIGRMTTTGAFMMFDVPTVDSSPRGIAVGPDGNLWFTEYQGDKIGRITLTGAIKEFALPTGSSPWEIIAGTDGIMYVTDSTSDDIARYDPATHRFMSSLRLPRSDNPWGLTIGHDHNVWFTGRYSAKIGVIVAGKVHEFKIPTTGAYPDDIAEGPDGIFYITDSLRNSISRFDPSTGSFLPRIILGTADIPTAIAVGPDGNMWFTVPSYTKPARIGRLKLN